MKTLIASTVLILALAACGQATPKASSGATTGSTAPASAAATTPVHVRDFTLEPKDVTVTGSVALAVANDGPTIHNVTIRDASGKTVGATPDLKQGESATLRADIPAGTYTLFCSLPGHESLGIKGTLTVTQ